MSKVSVLGDGGWGSALAILLSKNKHDVTLWSVFSDYAKVLQSKRVNEKFLPGIEIPKDIKISSNLQESIESAELVVLAIPSKYMGEVCEKISKCNYQNVKSFLSVSKGIEIESLKRMSEVISEKLPGAAVGSLSGPSHAEEVAKGYPCAVVVATEREETAKYMQSIFMGESFRVYTHSDIVGVELGGSLKNVIAIAVGICDGLGSGDNAKAALMTRGMAEIARLGVAMGGKRETFSGLAGIGDIIVTCTSEHGRNLRFGRMLAKGKTVKEITESTEMVVEGISTAKAAYELGKKYKVELPIVNEVYKVIYEGKHYEKALIDLMQRSPKSEMEW